MTEQTIRLVEILFGGLVALYIGYLQFGRNSNKTTTALKSQIQQLKKEKYLCENKRKNLQDAFKIVYEQYEKEWEQDPKQMGMLKGLKELIYDI
jgi:endonuclease III